MRKLIVLLLLPLFVGCFAEEPIGPSDPGGPRATTLATQYGAETLHPDGNPFWGHWWKFITWTECQQTQGCCFQPCEDSWTTVDEPLAQAYNEYRYIGAAFAGARHRLSFANPTGPADMNVSRLDLKFGRLGFNPDLYPYSQTLVIVALVNGDTLGLDSYQCYQWDECDQTDPTWTVTFNNLALTRNDLNTLELDLIAYGALRPDVAWLDVHHVEAEISYSYPMPPVILSKEIYTQVPCPDAYVRFTVDSGGTTGKVRYGATNCGTYFVNTTVIGNTHYASFDVSGLPTKFYWQVEATYQGKTTTGACSAVKKFQYAIEECPPPPWWP